MAPPRARTPEHPTRRMAHRVVLTVTFLFVLAAVSVSAGLVIHAAWLHDLENGSFAIAFAVLSVRAAFSWRLWLCSCQPSAISKAAKGENPRMRRWGRVGSEFARAASRYRRPSKRQRSVVS